MLITFYNSLKLLLKLSEGVRSLAKILVLSQRRIQELYDMIHEALCNNSLRL